MRQKKKKVLFAPSSAEPMNMVPFAALACTDTAISAVNYILRARLNPTLLVFGNTFLRLVP